MMRAASSFLIALMLLIYGTEYCLAAPTLTAAEYRAKLQQTEAALRRSENQTSRPLASILKELSRTRMVRRADGATQKAGGEEWKRRAGDAGTNATRAQMREARLAVEVRLQELDDWTRTSYQPADAGRIMRQLEEGGEIRTGPTRWQQLQADISKWWLNLLRSFTGWMGRTLPSSGFNPNADKVRLFFVISGVALLSILVFLAWRALSKRWSQEAAERQVRGLDHEDIELLQLPADELRDRARQYAQAGNFREALRHLYIALLRHLDTQGVWRYNARQTNWEHISALVSTPCATRLVAPLRDVSRRIDRDRYGNALCTNEEWQRFATDVENIEKLVGKA
jgi:hypothetical protein